MKAHGKGIVLVSVLILLSVSVGYCRMKQPKPLVEQLASVDELVQLFPKNVAQITHQTTAYISQTRKLLAALLAIPDSQRTFENTVQAYDFIGGLSDLAIHENIIGLMKEVHPDDHIRAAAQKSAQEIQAFWIDVITDNKAVYLAFKAYVDGNGRTQTLTDAQRYYISETMEGFKRAGLELDDERRAQLNALKKELVDLSLQFETNIAQDASTITVGYEQLSGLADDFIATLKKTESGQYIMGVDYPTYTMVMQNCASEDTRKRLKEAFDNRAYPINEPILKSIIAKRDQLAHLLGFESFAQFSFENQMAHSVDRVQKFLHDLAEISVHKVNEELSLWTADLPPSVSLTAGGKIKPWDIAFLQAEYKKKYLSLDERLVAQYFPLQKTIDGLFSIYEQFFGITFKQIPVSGLWDKDVSLVAVYNADGTQLHGYVFLDLYPRLNKYSHAAHGSIVPATYYHDKRLPSVGLVMANFPKATADKPALCMRTDVSTFFHEFGHALHAVLGRTQLAGQAGTSVKRDFVELPSQLLEEWLWDPHILKMISCHYQTGNPLSDELIERIIKLKTFDAGYFVSRQVMLSLIALDYYRAGVDKDVYAILRDLALRMSPRIAWSDRNHFYASWGHLTGYAASYYGYLWSRVFAQDVFETIKKEGLLNPVVGQKYVDTIIGRGGSADPNDLLQAFLGRMPTSKAFFRDLGLV